MTDPYLRPARAPSSDKPRSRREFFGDRLKLSILSASAHSGMAQTAPPKIEDVTIQAKALQKGSESFSALRIEYPAILDRPMDEQHGTASGWEMAQMALRSLGKIDKVAGGLQQSALGSW